MTMAIEAENAVEYEFRCFCGTPIVTSEKTVSCADCGKTFGIRRVGRRQHWKIAPPERPYRKLRLEDFELLANAIVSYLLLVFCFICLYYLGPYLLGTAE